jgi:hypothetical protein
MSLEEFKDLVRDQIKNDHPSNWANNDLVWAITDRLVQIEEKMDRIISHPSFR